MRDIPSDSIVLDHLLCVLSDLPSHENPKGVEPFWYPADLGSNAGRSLHFKVVQMQKFFFVRSLCRSLCFHGPDARSFPHKPAQDSPTIHLSMN